jgi:transcriptional regulator GlxA family with amidase domain
LNEGLLVKKIVIVIFDSFTDVDLFLMWDILGRNKTDWKIRILGTNAEHISAHGLSVKTHGHISEANDADVVLFSSGKLGVKAALSDESFVSAFSLDTERQLIGSICGGAFILERLGLLRDGPATTHPDAMDELKALGVDVRDQALVCNGNVATAGGCLSAVYLVGWLVEVLFGSQKRVEALRELIPAGQRVAFEQLIESSIREGVSAALYLPQFR